MNKTTPVVSRRLCGVVACVIGLAWAGSVNAGGTPVEPAYATPTAESPVSEAALDSQAATALQNLLAELQSLSGNFSQSLRDEQGELLQESRGQFSLKRPGKFYWHTQAPYEQVLVSDQKTLWLYDPDLEQVTVRPNAQHYQQTPMLLLSGDSQALVEQYAVLQRGGNIAGEQVFELRPRGGDSLFSTLALTFVDRRLRAMQLRDNRGQETRFTFTELTFNQAIDDELFQFQAPPGTDVLLDDAAPQ